MSSAAASRVFVGYRRLFRARKTLFRGDVQALQESRTAIKQEYVKNAAMNAQQDPVHFEGLLSMADEAVDMMLHGVVQGKLNQDSGNYEVKFEPEHVAGVEPRVEPITADVVDKMERFPDGVEITQTSSSKEGCKNSDKDH